MGGGGLHGVVKLLGNVNTGKFLLLPLESGECEISRTLISRRAISATTGNILVGEEPNVTDSHWSERERYKLEIGQRKLGSF
jgi:hypothetical protein